MILEEKINVFEALRRAIKHVFNYISEVDAKTRKWVLQEAELPNYSPKVEESDLDAMLNEKMPLELSIGEELYKIIDTQEELLENLENAPADRIEMDATMEIVTLMPNLYYVFPEMARLEIQFGAEVDTDKIQEYKFRFISGETPTELVLPEGVSCDFEVASDSVIEVSIIDNYAVAQSWAVSE